MLNRKQFLEKKLDKVNILEEKVEYTMLNGRRSYYDILEVNNTKVTVDWTNRNSLEELFRPRIFDDLVIPKSIISKLESWVKTKAIPNLVFYSRDGGTGKTSIAQVLSNESKNPSKCISANIDRGMDAVKESMLPFVQNADSFGKRKMLFIEEIGDATKAQVDSLKSVVDRYSKNSVLILTTNTMKNLSQPLLTRTKVFDFNVVDEEDQKPLLVKTYKRVMAILDILAVEYNEKDVLFLVKKYKNSYREIMVELETSIFDNKLEVNKLNSDNFDLESFLTAINEKDDMAIAKMSESINHIALLEYLSEKYLNHIEADSIQAFIFSLSSFQRDVNSAVPFLSISFLDFSYNLMNDSVKFRV